jgi:hypothetical protein
MRFLARNDALCSRSPSNQTLPFSERIAANIPLQIRENMIIEQVLMAENCVSPANRSEFLDLTFNLHPIIPFIYQLSCQKLSVKAWLQPVTEAQQKRPPTGDLLYDRINERFIRRKFPSI